jgi:hypothetical protein
MGMIFGQIAEVTEEKTIVEQQLQVCVSWIEAKIIAEILLANIKDYEQRNLNLPRSTH